MRASLQVKFEGLPSHFPPRPGPLSRWPNLLLHLGQVFAVMNEVISRPVVALRTNPNHKALSRGQIAGPQVFGVVGCSKLGYSEELLALWKPLQGEFAGLFQSLRDWLPSGVPVQNRMGS